MTLNDVIVALGWMRQEDHEFDTSLGTPYLKKKTKAKQRA